jgi:hypothetical protein
MSASDSTRSCPTNQTESRSARSSATTPRCDPHQPGDLPHPTSRSRSPLDLDRCSALRRGRGQAAGSTDETRIRRPRPDPGLLLLNVRAPEQKQRAGTRTGDKAEAIGRRHQPVPEPR